MKVLFVAFQWWFDRELAASFYQESCETLKNLDLEIVTPDELLGSPEEVTAFAEKTAGEEIACVLLQSGTFCTGEYITILAEHFSCPFVLWAVPEPQTSGTLRLNSLCGANFHASILHKLEQEYTYVYGAPNDALLAAELGVALRAACARQVIANTRIGLIGYHAPGFYALGFDEMLIRRVFGMTVDHLSLERVRAAGDEKPAEEEELNAVRAFMDTLTLNDDAEQTKNLTHMLLCFLRASREYAMDMMAIRCWPEAQQIFQTKVCSALSFLADHGVSCTCEGDVYSAITMRIQESMTKAPAWCVDFVQMNREDDTAVLWHCGNAPLAYLPNGEKAGVNEDGTLNFTCRAGPVTLCKLHQGKNGFRMLIAGGEAMLQDAGFTGTTMKLTFAAGAPTVLATVMDNGFEHHFCVCYGDIVREMKLFCKLTGIEPLVVDEKSSADLWTADACKAVSKASL